MSFVKPKYSKFEASGRFLGNQTQLRTSIPLIAEKMQERLREPFPAYTSFTSVSFVQDVPSSVKRRIKDEFDVVFSDKKEAYAVVIEDAVKVYSHSERGLLYGALALLGLSEEGYVHHGILYEAPVVEMRGVKVYLPGREHLEFFKEFIDFLAAFRVNTLMIEVGGAMEYKRHPEINQAWVKYCREIGEYSGKADSIQTWTYDWKKNSIHVENGDGGYLTQEEVRDIVEYCRRSCVDIIPEVPSLSHSDYLLLPHPELRERQNDEYPDTYCPSNEASYDLLFDVLDEVIEVFEPAQINIGHDEAYTFCKCRKCAEKDPVQVFVDDVLRIRAYLAQRGVGTIMWADKLLDARVEGKPCGGAHILKDYDDKEFIEEIPPIFKSADMLPNDISMFHWYWGLDEKYDDVFHEHSMPMIYGNFSPIQFKHWRRRVDRGIRGVVISNWSSVHKQNLQRNEIYFGLAFCNLLLWEDDYSESMAHGFAKRAMEMLYQYNYRNVKHGLRILHSTGYVCPYKMFYDGFFIVHEDYDMGSYKITFADGSELAVPIEYGLNISSDEVEWDCTDHKLPEVSLTTMPRRIESAGRTVTAYEFIVETKGSPITSIVYHPNPERKDARAQLYGIEAF